MLCLCEKSQQDDGDDDDDDDGIDRWFGRQTHSLIYWFKCMDKRGSYLINLNFKLI